MHKSESTGRYSLNAVKAGALVLTLGLGACSSSPTTGTAGSPETGKPYSFWPQPPTEPHIQFLRSFSGSEDVSPTQTSTLERLVLGSEKAADIQAIQKPYGVAMKNGVIYVCDIRGNCVTALDLKNKQTRLIGTSGLTNVANPADVEVADDGTIYIADSQRGAVLVYDKQERYRESFGHQGLKPVAVAVHGERLYVCDMAAHDVEIWDRTTGKSIGVIGSMGDDDGQFRLPLGVATDSKGNVYVMDMMRCRCQKFDADGKFISAKGQLGDQAGTFARPKQMAVDSEGIQYIVDANFQNVQMYDDQDRMLMEFGAAGKFAGSMDLPAGICVSDEGLEYFRDYIHPGFEAKRLILVTNQFGPNKVSVYALGARRESYPIAALSKNAATTTVEVNLTPERNRLQSVGAEAPAEGDQAGDSSGDDSAPAAKPGAGKTQVQPGQTPPTSKPKTQGAGATRD